MLGGDPPVREDSGGTGFQPVQTQAEACGYIFSSRDRFDTANSLPDTTDKRGFMDPKLKKWVNWLKVIEAEVISLVEAKDIFWSLQEMINNNIKIKKPSRFYNYMGNTYQAFILMGIRRQVKIDKQSISFARLLSEIERYPEKISRLFY
jgi:hypothetical protein